MQPVILRHGLLPFEELLGSRLSGVTTKPVFSKP
jgi:hypothetical protein